MEKFKGWFRNYYLIITFRYNICTDDWTELSVKLPTARESHSAMFMDEPIC